MAGFNCAIFRLAMWLLRYKNLIATVVFGVVLVAFAASPFCNLGQRGEFYLSIPE